MTRNALTINDQPDRESRDYGRALAIARLEIGNHDGVVFDDANCDALAAFLDVLAGHAIPPGDKLACERFITLATEAALDKAHGRHAARQTRKKE